MRASCLLHLYSICRSQPRLTPSIAAVLIQACWPGLMIFLPLLLAPCSLVADSVIPIRQTSAQNSIMAPKLTKAKVEAFTMAHATLHDLAPCDLSDCVSQHFPLAHSSLAMMAPLIFLRHCRPLTNLKFLHKLFSLPEMLFPNSWMADTFISFQSLIKYHLLKSPYLKFQHHPSESPMPYSKFVFVHNISIFQNTVVFTHC